MVWQQPRNSTGFQWWSASFGLIVSLTLKEQRNMSKPIYSFEVTFGYLLPVVQVLGNEHWTYKNILSQSSTWETRWKEHQIRCICAAAHFTWMSLIFPDCLGRSQVWHGLYITGCKNVAQVKHIVWPPQKSKIIILVCTFPWAGIHLHCSPVYHPSACVDNKLKL